jgi:hypothetical protein
MPLEVDLVRGLRYLVLTSIISGFTFFVARLESITGPRWWQRSVTAGAVVVVGFLTLQLYQVTDSLNPVKSLLTRGIDTSAVDKERIALAQAIAATPPGAVILPSSLPSTSSADFIETRYYARRSLAHAWKDGNVLSYANQKRLKQWSVTRDWLGKAHREKHPREKLARLINIARARGAGYLLVNAHVHEPERSDMPVTPLFIGSRASLLRIDVGPVPLDPDG